jgi:hypothetical protein
VASPTSSGAPRPARRRYIRNPPSLRKKSYRGVWIGVAVMFAVVILVLATLYVLFWENPTVKITAIEYQFTGDSCVGWDDGAGNGTTVHAGQSFNGSILLTNAEPAGNCTAENVTTTSGGFSVTNSDAPISVVPGGEIDLTFVIHTPSYTYTGVITLVITVKHG